MKSAFDLVIVGAGPAGMAAARAAADSGMKIAIVDDNPKAGGQIWRGGPIDSADKRAVALWSALHEARNIEFFFRSRICGSLGGKNLLAETPGGALTLRYEKLILSTGARERLLPFPGWTLPGVSGAGGLQALSKGGYPVAGKRIVVAGSGPLLLAVAATLKTRGAQVIAILEQAPLHRLARFALTLPLAPSKLVQALQLRKTLSDMPYRANSYVVAAKGNERIRQVSFMQNGRPKTVKCDYLACGYGLIPNTELATALGCETRDGEVQVDRFQATSVPDVYCAGEGTGIGGVDLSLAEGRIAGLAATGRIAQAENCFVERERWQVFARRLARTFALRAELRELCAADTIVCRCEDVKHGELVPHSSWRSAKLHTRCGMGPCQGRVCGGATGFLYGWTQDSVRQPLAPTRISTLLAGDPSMLSADSEERDIQSV